MLIAVFNFSRINLWGSLFPMTPQIFKIFGVQLINFYQLWSKAGIPVPEQKVKRSLSESQLCPEQIQDSLETTMQLTYF